MPMHKGFFPREGFCADVLLKVIRATALNPALLLPVLLLARFSRRGQDLAVLHPTALSRLRTLFCVAVARKASAWLSNRVRNNWVADRYDWSREVVLVTGGAGGIGGSMVKLFEEMGITVVVLDVQPMSFATSDKVHYYQCDIRSPAKLAAVAETIAAEVGPPTVVINNAGVARGKTLLDADPSDIRFTFDVNALAPFWVAKTFLPHMVRRDHGMVVTVTSYAAWLTTPNMVDYGASKAAAMGLHEGLTAELTTRYKAPRVRTVIVHPGHTRTALFTGYDQKTDFVMPQLEPESIAEAVVKQVLTGKSGQVVLPQMGVTLPSLRMMPDWYSMRVRAKAESYMANFSGRQVIKDVGAAFEGSEGKGSQGSQGESTVLV